MGPTDQPALFRLPGPVLAPVADGVRFLADRLPPGLRMGTSSWSFEGWPIWGRPCSTEVLAREGLAPYAQHPLHRAVGVDRSWHAPVDAATWAHYRSQVPDGFRFVVKAWQDLTWARFPNHPRHGDRAGLRNPGFLDPALAEDVVIGPLVEGLGPGALLLFQFPPQEARDLGAERFCDRLGHFLQALPRTVRPAIELRHRDFGGPRYVEALAAGDALHCLAIHPSCPDLRTQWTGGGVATQPELLVRWSLTEGRYADQRQQFAPFDKVVARDPDLRDAIAKACRWATARGRPATVIANNKAEGCAPGTLQGIAEALAALDR